MWRARVAWILIWGVGGFSSDKNGEDKYALLKSTSKATIDI